MHVRTAVKEEGEEGGQTYMQVSPPTPSVFFSHAWDLDSSDRNTHARVKTLCRAVGAQGVHTWFDSDQLAPGDDIVERICNGIDNATVFAACATPAYMHKCREGNTHCHMEVHYAHKRVPANRRVVVVMDAKCAHPHEWTGTFGAMFNSALYLRCTTDAEEDVRRVARSLAAVCKKQQTMTTRSYTRASVVPMATAVKVEKQSRFCTVS